MSKRPPIPDTMQAVAIDRFGPPDVLQMHTLRVPKIKAAQVLIRVHTAGVGGWDARIRSGSWAERKEFPQILGTDGSGEVVAAGASVKRFRRGDRVMGFAYPEGGFYAEYVAVAAGNVGVKPRRLDMVQA